MIISHARNFPHVTETFDVSSFSLLEEASFANVSVFIHNPLTNLRSISIYAASSVSDVSYFRNVSRLYFEKCPNITDVACLGNVHTLGLVECLGITDVSSLGGVYNLNLERNRTVRDLSALKNIFLFAV
jgi:hypothetical protein